MNDDKTPLGEKITLSTGATGRLIMDTELPPSNASKKRDWLLIGLIYAVALLMLLTTYFMVARYVEQGVKLRTVYSVCQFTRLTEASETACGIAQDQSNTEYLCKERNASDTNVCWVEQK